MYKSIRVKIFLTLLLTTIVVAAGMYSFMRLSFERGFMSFVESRQQKQLDNVLATLTEYYDSHQEWHSLSSDKKKWLEMIWQVNSRPYHQPPPWIYEASVAKDNIWPPIPPERLPSRSDHEKMRSLHLIPLELRLMLLNADKSLLLGRAELVRELSLTPIVNKNQTVGFLGVLPGKPLRQISDIRFMERQAQELVWITISMILLSAGLALLIAYGLGKPLKRITAASKALAVGRYDTRLPVDSNDELGQLARNFNALAEALAQAEQTRQRWVADISHELRTPIAVLRGELEALQDGVRPLCPAAVDSLYGDVMRLNRLAEDLYQLALSDQGALTYRKALIDPVGLLEYDLSALANDYQRKEITVVLEKPLDTTPLLHADPDRLSQLYRNLLNNTLHYTDNNGQLCITISGNKDHLTLAFADSGPGISDEALPKLFERFYRVDSSRNRSLGGAGLGLAICRNIVEAHNGTITATHSLGGLEIRVTLPISL